MLKDYKKILSAVISAIFTFVCCNGIPLADASDIEIYKTATAGKTSILLMLDTSGSMGISSLVLPKTNTYGSPGDVDSSLCAQTAVPEYDSGHGTTYNIYEWTYNLKDTNTTSPTYGKSSIYKYVTIGTTKIPYYVRGCTNGVTTQYDRLSRLKDAILPLLASDKLNDAIVMGLGQFSSKTELTIGSATNTFTDGHSGRILVPNSALTSAQRIKIAQQIAAIKSLDTTTNEDGTANSNLKLSSNNYPNVIKASSGTPTAHAYAEAGAYMMGTGTGNSGVNSGQISTIYDGYMVMQNGTNQAYFICVEVGSGTTSALGATVKQCINNWPSYDSTNQTVSTDTISNGIYKPNGSGGWAKVTSQADFKSTVGKMASGWETFSKLPEGWRYGGWMKVNNEPMDIEPIVGTVWTGYAGGTLGIVSYRTSPFSIKNGDITQTTVTQGFQDCPSGYTAISTWQSLCAKTGLWSRYATASERIQGKCLAPADGSTDPLPNARDTSGNLKTDEHYNMRNTDYNYYSGTCTQKTSAVVRPWGDVKVTTTTTGSIDNNEGGFAYSASDTKNGAVYKAGGATNTCDGNGVYFLTDGAPNSTKDSMAQTIMNTSLTSKYAISSKPTGGLVSPVLQSNLFSGETGGWEYIGKYAQILNSANNPLGKAIKTAVVGFGSSFSGLSGVSGSTDISVCNAITNVDAKNACLWGSSSYGNGGIYYAEDSSDIANSIIDFVNKVSVAIDPINTGSPTIPTDALNPSVIQPFGYYATVTPTPEKTYQLWAGNMNKYQILNGVLAGSNSINLLTSSGLLDTNATGYWTGGVKGQLTLLNTTSSSNTVKTSQRIIYTNRIISGNTASESYSSLSQVNLDSLLNSSGSFNNDPNKGYWLNALGYDIDPTTANISASTLIDATELRQLGSTMHSSPLLLTQSGKITYSSSGITTQNRDDYLLFGSTQGILHVVQVGNESKQGTAGYSYPGGKEVFAFVPNEMMENQKEAFRNISSTSGSLFYGIDAPWTAYTQYRATSDGSLSVNVDTNVTGNGSNISGKSLQWVYGGLRMGGRSYYALDLSNILSPKLKFHLDPDKQKVWSAEKGELNYPQLKFMGQSWSKPTITWVNYGGTKRLVMFVGGGYDLGYESKTYNQTNGVGGSVYMFDASTGELLWWLNNDSTKGTYKATDSSGKILSVKTAYKKEAIYSVVSQIDAVDRDGDGLADHLYFGDLGGQVFRIDMNNNSEDSGNWVNKGHIVRLLNLHQTNGLSPRFYDTPSLTIHTGVNGKFGALSIASGNRSSPLADSTQSANDAVYIIYDNDVARTDLFTITVSESDQTALRTKDITLLVFDGINGVNQQNANSAYNGGWYKNFSSVAGDYKGMNGLYAVGNLLYVNTFYRKGTGISGACNSGVTGDSYVFRFCLPTGKCSSSSTATTGGMSLSKVGAGLLGTSLSMQTVNGVTYLTTSAGNTANPSTSVNGTPSSSGLKQLRWYESQ